MIKIKSKVKNHCYSKTTSILIFFLLSTLLLIAGCSSESSSNTTNNQEEEEITNSENSNEEVTDNATNSQENPFTSLSGEMTLNPSSGPVRTKVNYRVEGLEPNQDSIIIWETVEGSYLIEDLFTFVGSTFETTEIELQKEKTDQNGVLEGIFAIPEDFGGDHNVIIYQNGEKKAQANFFVETTFSVHPESGPIGSEITIIGEGLGWRMYGSLWHVNYDNAYTGMLTAVSTNGKAEGKIRAAGTVGEHTITIESGASGFPFLNRDQSAVNFINTQRFSYTITDDNSIEELTYVEEVPIAADGGIQMPPIDNKEGVTIQLDTNEGIVGETVTMSGEGLPPNEEITILWNTMVGSRVTSAGFGEESRELDKIITDNNGSFTYEFPIPDDLGGPPHRIDIQVDNETYGQTYLRILPSIVKVSPSSGPVGTEFEIVLKGMGWTEYDNAYQVTYNNAYIGYVCGFNSQGTITIPLVASGNPGYQIIDIYPGIYKGQQVMPDYFIRPQLTYQHDHPGTAIPAIRVAFEVTEE